MCLLALIICVLRWAEQHLVELIECDKEEQVPNKSGTQASWHKRRIEFGRSIKVDYVCRGRTHMR